MKVCILSFECDHFSVLYHHSSKTLFKYFQKYTIKIEPMPEYPRKLVKITDNKVLMYNFFAIKIASFIMKNLQSTLNIWTIPFLKHFLHQTSFTYIPNIFGYIVGTFIGGAVLYKLRKMSIFYPIIISNGIMTMLVRIKNNFKML